MAGRIVQGGRSMNDTRKDLMLEFRGVHTWYGAYHALDDINLDRKSVV